MRRAVALDMHGKALDPQPFMAWNVDRTDVVTLQNGTLTPVRDGVARVEASIGALKASYTFTVELSGDESVEARPSYSHGTCPTTDYGNGVYVFGCDKSGFPYALSEFLETRRVTVSAISPLINHSGGHTEANSYLVTTNPN